MTIQTLTNANFETVTNSHEIIVVEFWAKWCAPCKGYDETLSALAKEHPDILFAKVDIEAEADLAKDFAVRSIPLLIIMRQQIAVFMESGVLPKAALEDLLQQTRDLDMDQVVMNLSQENIE